MNYSNGCCTQFLCSRAISDCWFGFCLVCCIHVMAFEQITDAICCCWSYDIQQQQQKIVCCAIWRVGDGRDAIVSVIHYLKALGTWWNLFFDWNIQFCVDLGTIICIRGHVHLFRYNLIDSEVWNTLNDFCLSSKVGSFRCIAMCCIWIDKTT